MGLHTAGLRDYINRAVVDDDTRRCDRGLRAGFNLLGDGLRASRPAASMSRHLLEVSELEVHRARLEPAARSGLVSFTLSAGETLAVVGESGRARA